MCSYRDEAAVDAHSRHGCWWGRGSAVHASCSLQQPVNLQHNLLLIPAGWLWRRNVWQGQDQCVPVAHVSIGAGWEEDRAAMEPHRGRAGWSVTPVACPSVHAAGASPASGGSCWLHVCCFLPEWCPARSSAAAAASPACETQPWGWATVHDLHRHWRRARGTVCRQSPAARPALMRARPAATPFMHHCAQLPSVATGRADRHRAGAWGEPRPTAAPGHTSTNHHSLRQTHSCCCWW